VKRSIGFSARGSKGQVPLSGSLERGVATVEEAAATGAATGATAGAVRVEAAGIATAGMPCAAGMLAEPLTGADCAGIAAGETGSAAEVSTIFAADGIITAIFVGIALPVAGWLAKSRISASRSWAVWSI
jgi:hypothetical protein